MTRLICFIYLNLKKVAIKRAAFLLIISCSFKVSVSNALTCSSILSQEVELKVNDLIPYTQVFIINNQRAVKNLSFTKWFDLSFEYDSSGERTSLIGLTKDGEVFHLVKEGGSWSSFARKLSGEFIVRDLKVTNKGKILVRVFDQDEAHVFSSKYLFIKPEDQSHPLVKMLKYWFGPHLDKDGFVRMDFDYEESAEWYLNERVKELSSDNLDDFDSAILDTKLQ